MSEALLRVALVAGLALALWRSLHPAAPAVSTLHADTRGLAEALSSITRSASIRSLDLTVDSMPGAPVRAWLSAVRRAGVPVRWHGSPPALAMQVERAGEPESRARIAIAGDSASTFVVADSAGPVDTLRMTSRGARLETVVLVGPVRAVRGRWAASAAVPQPVVPRAVLVLGRVGWEAKFTAAALQEAGWTVRARQPAAPGVVVADAGVLPIDTSRYAAVIALDSTAGDLGPAIARFVGQGGGLVAAGDAAAIPLLASLSPARMGARAPGRVMLDGDSVTRESLPMRPLVALRADAVRLESTGGEATFAARRAGMGRVAAVGYDETWRWRMLGGASGPAAHRAWWSRTVGLVSPVPADTSPPPQDAAPTAALAEALGPRAAGAPSASPTDAGEPLPVALLAAVVVVLLAETASRRFRGAP